MADNRKYYYLKLKENYFDDDSIVLLESIQDGMIYTTQITLLETREKQLEVNLKALKKPAGMIEGLALFALFSLFNIIVPLMLTLFNFAEHHAVVVASVSISFLMIGLVSTFIYLAWMLKWKKDGEM